MWQEGGSASGLICVTCNSNKTHLADTDLQHFYQLLMYLNLIQFKIIKMICA